MKGFIRLSGGRKIRSPIALGTRPTTSRVREAVMDMLAYRINGSYWLDLCCGSGAIGCEALERGARGVVAVEKNLKVARICKANLELVQSGLDRVVNFQVFSEEVVRWLRQISSFGDKDLKTIPKFDFVYFDPPYSSNLYMRVLHELSCGNLLTSESIVVCEHSSENILEIPNPWIQTDRRKYGGSSLVLLSPPESYLGDTGSKQLQTVPAR